MLFTQLKEKTSSIHQQAEKILVGKLKGIKTIEDYIHILNLFVRFYTPLENSISEFIDDDVLQDYNQRKKTTLLLQDLHHLNFRLPINYASENQQPAINNTLNAIGALYVLEGSTLGGIIIAEMLAKVLKLNSGLSFFNCYGVHTHQMWQHFKLQVENHHYNTAAQDVIIASAIETFERFKEFLMIDDREKQI